MSGEVRKLAYAYCCIRSLYPQRLKSGSKLSSKIPTVLKLRRQDFGGFTVLGGIFLGARQQPRTELLRFADLEKDGDLLDAARSVAEELLCDHAEAAKAPSFSAGWGKEANI